MNVTYETAVKLKEAGFPHPEITYLGMVYYEPKWTLNPQVVSAVVGQRLRDSEVFAPAATDILREVPGLSVYYSGMDLWNTNNPFEGSFDCDYRPLSNPAEAAARFWLAIKAEGKRRNALTCLSCGQPVSENHTCPEL